MKQKITEEHLAAQILGRLSARKRHEGKSDEWVSRYYKKLRAKRNATKINEDQG